MVVFYNSTEWKIYKCLLGVIQELHFPLTVWEEGSIYDLACNQWSILLQGNGKVSCNLEFVTKSSQMLCPERSTAPYWQGWTLGIFAYFLNRAIFNKVCSQEKWRNACYQVCVCVCVCVCKERETDRQRWLWWWIGWWSWGSQGKVRDSWVGRSFFWLHLSHWFLR
jgi:hypothetical protein